jgi:hypothetical protein
MPKDKKKKRKDKRKKGPGLQSYRPGAGLSQQDLLLSLIGRMGSGYGGGHVSVQVPNYSGMGGTGQNSAIMDELGRLGGLVDTLVADSRRGVPAPGTSAPSATFQMEPEEEPAAAAPPFVFGDPANILTQAPPAAPTGRPPVIRLDRPTRLRARRPQNNLVAAVEGIPIAEVTDIQPAIPMRIDLTQPQALNDTRPPSIFRQRAEPIQPIDPSPSQTPPQPIVDPPLFPASTQSINPPRPHNVTVETVDDEDEDVEVDDDGHEYDDNHGDDVDDDDADERIKTMMMTAMMLIIIMMLTMLLMMRMVA